MGRTRSPEGTSRTQGTTLHKDEADDSKLLVALYGAAREASWCLQRPRLSFGSRDPSLAAYFEPYAPLESSAEMALERGHSELPGVPLRVWLEVDFGAADVVRIFGFSLARKR